MKLFLLKSFRNGLSDWESAGIEGSFKFGSNLDIRKNIDSLSCQQALTDDLAAGTMTGLVIATINATDGNAYLFCTDGKIFKRTSAGVYSLVYTDSDGLITGAEKWQNDAGNKYLIWATATKLHRKEIPGVSNWSDVDATFNGQSYPKSNLTSATWHTMKVIEGDLYIANADALAMVGYDDSYTTNALQLVPGDYAKSLLEYDGYAYIGSVRTDNSGRANLYIWDTAQSLNWNKKRQQGTDPINSMIDAEFPIMQSGSDGRLGLVDTSAYNLPLTSFPGGGSTYPGGVEVSGDLALFGVYGNGTGKTGVYTFGRKKKNANLILNLDYALTCDSIGSVTKVGTDLLISYKNGSDYGVKKVSTTTKATGTYQSLDLKAPSDIREPVWGQVRIVTAPLPSGCSVEVWRRMDKNGSFVQANMEGGSTSFSTTGGQEAVFYLGDKGKICEVQLVLNPSANYTPEVYTVEVFFG